MNISDAQTFLNNTYRSTIAYQKWWPGKPFRLSVSANHNQNTQTRDFNVQLPQMNFAISRVNPFQRKVPTGGRKWYENIGFFVQFRCTEPDQYKRLFTLYEGDIYQYAKWFSGIVYL